MGVVPFNVLAVPDSIAKGLGVGRMHFRLEQRVISLVLSPRTEMRRDPVVLAL
jgi:hypothetical protein